MGGIKASNSIDSLLWYSQHYKAHYSGGGVLATPEREPGVGGGVCVETTHLPQY